MTKDNVSRAIEAKKTDPIGPATMAIALIENKATNLEVAAKSTHAKEVTHRECTHQAKQLRAAAEVLRTAPATAAECAQIRAEIERLRAGMSELIRTRMGAEAIRERLQALLHGAVTHNVGGKAHPEGVSP